MYDNIYYGILFCIFVCIYKYSYMSPYSHDITVINNIYKSDLDYYIILNVQMIKRNCWITTFTIQIMWLEVILTSYRTDFWDSLDKSLRWRWKVGIQFQITCLKIYIYIFKLFYNIVWNYVYYTFNIITLWNKFWNYDEFGVER